jgi:hypothetical protein
VARQKPAIHFDFWTDIAPELHNTCSDLAQGTEVEILRRSAMTDPTSVGVNVTAAMALYLKYGQQVFTIGPRLCDSFLHAKLDNVPTDLIRFPYPAFYVAPPVGALQVWGGSRTQYHDVGGIYVYNINSPLIFKDGSTAHLHQTRLIIWGKPNERSEHAADDALYWFGVDWQKDQSDLEGTLRHQIDTTSYLDELRPRDGTGASRVQQTAVNTLRIVLNLCLYLLSENRDVIVDTTGRDQQQRMRRKAARLKGRSRQRLLDRANRKSGAVVTYLAPGIEAEGAAGGDGHRSPRRHWVRLHRQTYWIGPGSKQPVIRYINPYERGGREADEPPARQYQVKEGTS